METTINTFSKYKAYKEKRVREFIHKYNAVCWVSWGCIWSGCGICVLMLLALIVHYYTEEELVLFSNVYLVFILIPIFVFCTFIINKENGVRGLIQKYNVLCRVLWGWIWGGCGICVLMLLALIVHYHIVKEVILFSNIYLVFILIPVFAFTILAGIKYIRSLYVQHVVYDYLKHLSCYEIYICYKIKLDTLRDEIQGNNREADRLKCMIQNLDLKCQMIDKLITMNYCNKSFVRTESSMSLDEKMIKNEEILLQEICGYHQLTNKYNVEIELLQKENDLLHKRMQEIREIMPDKEQIVKKIDTVIDTDLELCSKEIRAFFTDLIEVVSQVKQ